MRQLDLLNWDQTTVVPFPPARRAALVRSTASILGTECDADGAKFWTGTIKVLTTEMRNLGLTDNAIQIRLLDFRDAVEIELNSGISSPVAKR